MSRDAVNPRTLVPVLVLLVAIGPVSLNMPLPAVPGLAAALNASVAEVQWIITLFLFGLGAAQLVVGPLADRYGRRPVLVVGLSLAILTGLAAAWAESIEWLLTARALQSLGASSGVVLGRAIIRDLYDRDRAAAMMGWVTMAMVVAPTLSPMLGGLLLEGAGWRWIFVATAAFAALGLLAAYALLPETRPHDAASSFSAVGSDARALLTNREFLAFTAVAGFFNITFFAFVGGAPHVVLTVMGATPVVYGLWFMVNGFGYMIGNALAGRYSERLGGYRMLQIGTLLGLAAIAFQFAFALAGLMTSPAWLFIPQAICALANGLVLPSAIAGAVSVIPRAAGSAAGISGAIQMLFAALAAQVAGVAVDAANSPLPMTLIIAVSSVLAYLSFQFLRRED